MRSFLSGWDTTSREPCALCGARATYGMVGTSDQPSGQQREAAAHLHAVKDLWYTMSASRSEATAEMGELLLRGWAMLAEACPQCHIPLMEEKPTGKKLCVGCQRTSWSTDASDRSQAEEDVSHAANKVDVSTDANRTDPSDLLAERMLQGWALLGVVCPVCRTPLVKNKEQITYCVSCDMPVREANSPARMDDNIKRDVSMVTVNATQAGQTEAALANRKRYPSDASVDDITTKAKLVIQQKMGEAAELLRSMSPAAAGDCTDLVKLIRECHATLATMK